MESSRCLLAHFCTKSHCIGILPNLPPLFKFVRYRQPSCLQSMILQKWGARSPFFVPNTTLPIKQWKVGSINLIDGTYLFRSSQYLQPVSDVHYSGHDYAYRTSSSSNIRAADKGFLSVVKLFTEINLGTLENSWEIERNELENF